MNVADTIRDVMGENVLFEEPMSRHTTFRIGGPAWIYCTPQDAEQVKKIIMLCRKEELPFRVKGNGSNLLFPDDGYDGILLDMTKGMNRIVVDGERVTAEAGVLLGSLARQAAAAGLTGLEFAGGIPGSVGGALVMNAGAYGGEMCQVVESASVLTPEGEIKKVDAAELELSYRHSAVKANDWIVLEAVFVLKKGDPEMIRSTMEDLAARRREKQPLEYPSAGSTFKRPLGYFAAALIDQAGLKGMTVGGAQVSPKHAGFVVNAGNATAKDVLTLCEEIRNRVRVQFGVELEMEVEVVQGCHSLPI